MNTSTCDHTSVGIIVRDNTKYLLIERQKFPFGFASVSGHVDGDTSFEIAAHRELAEEVGLKAERLKLVLERRLPNKCRRHDGEWHDWKVYVAEGISGDLLTAPDEVKQAQWFTKDQLYRLIEKTERYQAGQITEDEWQKSPGLEPLWLEFLQKIDEELRAHHAL